jgi:uncharacterized membrane protein YccC
MDVLSDYVALTGGIVQLAGSDKLVHTWAGMAIYVVAQVALRTRRASPIAFQIVVALQLGNEVMDRLYWDSWRWPDTIGDTVATLFWPGTLCLLGYYRRSRWRIEEAAAKAARDQVRASSSKSSESKQRPSQGFAPLR